MLNVYRKFKSHIARWLYSGSYKPGHFYSPIPSIGYIHANQDRIFDVTNTPADIDLNVEFQLKLLNDLLIYYPQYSFPFEASSSWRYYANNTYFNYTDSLSLFLLLNQFKPARIIEVGSGYSSACMLDTFDKFLKYTPQLTFIEPYADRLRSLLKPDELEKYSLLEKEVQHVHVSKFMELGENDLLFIDSSHVSKAGSDLNYILFEVLPVLKQGVIIHFHDICYPFEYPKEWLEAGIYWNESYLLRAFLMNNSAYEVILFNHFLSTNHKEWLTSNMPGFKSGGSLYLRKK
jgi:hypothetical protein